MDRFVLLEEELELVKLISISKARFGDRLNVVYNIKPGLTIRFLPFILQPLVENAVRHGIYPQKRRNYRNTGRRPERNADYSNQR